MTDIPLPTEGTLIRGTMRSQDLIPAFLGAISTYAPEEYCQLISSPFGAVPAYALEDDKADWWESEDASMLCNELFELLNDVAPDGMYFGAHNADGSDYGFWSINDECI